MYMENKNGDKFSHEIIRYIRANLYFRFDSFVHVAYAAFTNF